MGKGHPERARGRRGPLLGLLLVCAALVSSGDAAAQTPKTPADALFEQARTLMLEGRHVEACPKLEESQRLDPAVGTLLHLGECFAKTGRTASAWRAFRQAISAARNEGAGERERVALARAQALEPDLSRLQISVPLGTDVEGLQIRADGVDVPRASWGAAVPVDLGPHVVEASAPGKGSWRAQAAVMTIGATVVVAVPALVAESPPPRANEGPAPGGGAEPRGPIPETAPNRFGTLGYATLAGGVVLSAVGAGFGVAAIRSWAASRSACEGNVCSDSGVADARSAQTSATVSTALFATGAVALGTGAVLLWRGQAKPSRAALWLAPSVAGVTAGGQFN